MICWIHLNIFIRNHMHDEASGLIKSLISVQNTLNQVTGKAESILFGVCFQMEHELDKMFVLCKVRFLKFFSRK